MADQYDPGKKLDINTVTEAMWKLYGGAFGYTTVMVASDKQDADFKAGKPIMFELGNSEGHAGFTLHLSPKQQKNLEDALKRDPGFCNNVAFYTGIKDRDDFNYRRDDNGFGPTLTIENSSYFRGAQLNELAKREHVVTTLLEKGLDAAKQVAASEGLYKAPSSAPIASPKAALDMRL